MVDLDKMRLLGKKFLNELPEESKRELEKLELKGTSEQIINFVEKYYKIKGNQWLQEMT